MFSFGYIGKNVIFVIYNSNNVNINVYMINLKIKIPKIKRNVVKTNNNINKRFEVLDGEIWVPISFNPNYKISNKGRILTTRGTIAKPFVNNSGYLCIGLWKNNIKTNKLVHILVAMHFMDYNSKYDVDHIDNNKQNNDISNLQLVTHSDNCSMRNTPKIYNVTKSGDIIGVYNSYREAAYSLGYGSGTLIKHLKNSVRIVKIRNYKYNKDCYFIRK